MDVVVILRPAQPGGNRFGVATDPFHRRRDLFQIGRGTQQHGVMQREHILVSDARVRKFPCGAESLRRMRLMERAKARIESDPLGTDRLCKKIARKPRKI